MFHRMKALLTGVALAVGLAGPASAQTVVVGSKNFTEQQLLGAITAQYLQARNVSVDLRTGMGSAALRKAMESRQVHVYWEYTGTSLITYNKVTEKLDAAKTYARVKELDAEAGIVWLNPSTANNTYAFAMQRKEAEAQGIRTLSDLAAKVNGGEALTIGSNAEFYTRSDGLKPLEKAYGFQFGRSNIRRMDTGLVYGALRNGDVDVGLVFATDGRIPAFDFVVLKDDKGFFPSYAIAPVIRQEVLEANPAIGQYLNDISAKLDDATMARLNASVDVDRVTIERAAAEFLKSSGLL